MLKTSQKLMEFHMNTMDNSTEPNIIILDVTKPLDELVDTIIANVVTH